MAGVFIKVIIPSYNCYEWIERCLDSVAAQTYKNYDVIVIDDASTDHRQPAFLKQYCAKRKRWHPLFNQTNMRCPYNLALGIEALAPNPDDVIFILDGDDFIPSGALERIATEYQDSSVWLTYGNYEPHPHNTGQNPAQAYPEAVLRGRAFRAVESAAFNHPLTFRYFLWNEVTEEDLQDDFGNWFRGGYDYAIMLPMLEMAAPDHIRFLDEVLYFYNSVNPISDVHVNLDDALAARCIVTRPVRAQLVRSESPQ